MDQLSESQTLKLEQDFVKHTYDNIAEDFSFTRYKKWPKVDAFLKSLPYSSLLLDVGCGNGKYLDNQSTINIGCDMSFNLLKICKNRNFEVVQCDMSRLPFREAVFDSVICIAALHHVVSAQRRQLCLEKLINSLIPNGKLLIQVWSYEQNLDQNNPYIKRNHQVETENHQLLEVIVEENLTIPVHINRTQFKNQDLLVPFHVKKQEQESCSSSHSGKHQLRYYHVFKRGELDSMFEQLRDAVISDSYYDRGNWCVIASRSCIV